jgi:hypothetical protein
MDAVSELIADCWLVLSFQSPLPSKPLLRGVSLLW